MKRDEKDKRLDDAAHAAADLLLIPDYDTDARERINEALAEAWEDIDNREGPEPDYDAGPPESCPVYRQNMKDAGRGHQLP